jgi:uncharacterized repeat protein (TIGR01451 family)
VITVGTPSTFALSLKKYVDSVDAQPGAPVTKNVGDIFNYVIRVTNNGPASVSGTTTVVDTLPTGVTQSGTVSASPWNCSVSGQTVTCTVTAAIASGANFPDITIPVKINTSVTA